jgi:hypothetical protein
LWAERLDKIVATGIRRRHDDQYVVGAAGYPSADQIARAGERVQVVGPMISSDKSLIASTYGLISVNTLAAQLNPHGSIPKNSMLLSKYAVAQHIREYIEGYW